MTGWLVGGGVLVVAVAAVNHWRAYRGGMRALDAGRSFVCPPRKR